MRILLKALLVGLAASSVLRVWAQSYPTQTTAPQNYFVSWSLGNDANSCTSSVPLWPLQLGPCKTIQGALDKIPKRLRHVVTVTVDAGYYDGFVVEGFEVHPSWTRDGLGAGLIIQGTTKPASPKTGTAAGTVSSCVAGGLPDPNTHSTLTDLKQNWTPHDSNLRGRKLCLTSGAGKDQCLAIEDNTATVITLAGYWSDFHADWPDMHLWPNCQMGDTYAITEPATHLDRAVSLPQGVGGKSNGQGRLDDLAAIIVSNVHGGASATADNGQPADNFQILVKDFDVLADDWKGGHVVHSVAYVDSSDHVGFKHFTTGINTLNPAQQHPGLYSGNGLFTFRNSTAWTVQSSYANGDAPTTTSSPMISCSRSATADTLIGVFGNVVDNMPAYFGDEAEDQTSCHSSVIFGGESIRNTGGNVAGDSPAAITIGSAALVYFVGTQINGSRINPNTKQPFTADCVRLGNSRGAGFGRAYFEGGDFSNCSGSGVNIQGSWIATFINVPTTSAAGPHGQFGIEAANGAKILALSYAFNGGINSLRGKYGDLSFDGPNHAAFFSYSQVQSAPGQTITDPQRGGLFSFGNGEAISATSAVPPNWVSYGQGTVYGFTLQAGGSYSAKNYDHVIGMSSDAARKVTIPGNSPAGTHYIIIDTSSSANPGHTITVTASAGMINGIANAVITPGTNKALEVISDGKNYWIISVK